MGRMPMECPPDASCPCASALFLQRLVHHPALIQVTAAHFLNPQIKEGTDPSPITFTQSLEPWRHPF